MKPHGRVPPAWSRRAGRRRVVAPVAVALALAACSGDDASPPATSAPVTNPPLPTSATTAPTTEPTTEPTVPPTAVGDDHGSASSVPATDPAVIVDAAVAAWTAWNDVLLDPTNDARLEAVARTHTGEALQRAVDTAARWRIENRKSITNPDAPAFIQADPSSVVFDTETGVATIEYCHLDSNVSVEIGGNEDGSDRVIDDTVTIRFEREEYRLVDGRWLKSGGTSLGDDRPGEMTCPG